LAHILERVFQHGKRFLKVNDVNLVAMAVNKRGHLGVPEAGLVTEVHAGFQHLAHGNAHDEYP
jgi:hypothetical protein